MKSTLKILSSALAVTLLALAGCDKRGRASASAPASQGDLSADTVVATIGSEKITAGQLDEQVKGQLQAIEKQKFQTRKQGLEKMVMDKLLKSEAEKKGMTAEQYVKAEIDDKVAP